jgi:hypothetical protein
MAPLSIHSLRINNGLVEKNSAPLLHLQGTSPDDAYRSLGYNYLKFFKMDVLCKWAWLGAEALLRKDQGFLYEGADKNTTAVVLATKHGSLAVDKRYQETLDTIPSPALFVYTLPNIMLGEICIRHGFKGEQLCLVQDAFNEQEIIFWVKDLFKNRGMKYCLFGWADAVDDHYDVCLFWASAKDENELSAAAIAAVYNTSNTT